MKKNEIALLVLIVGIVALGSYFLVKSFVADATPKSVSVDVAKELSSTVIAPNKDIFAEGNYNPTIKIKIGDQTNQQIFNNAQ
jgi:hypothetical protein